MGTSATKTPPAEIAVYSLKVERQKLDRFIEASKAKNRTAAQQFRHLMDQEVREFEANGEATAS